TLSLSVFFFFQAEDGIRDSSVTGVQTCALPISTVVMPAASASVAVSGHESALKTLQLRPDTLEKWSVLFGALLAVSILVTARRRSEERRVGKECRCVGGASG